MMNKRFLEFIPGFSTWLILLMPAIFSFFQPTWVAIFIILFDFYWLCKATTFSIYLLSGYTHMSRALRINWRRKLEELNNPLQYLEYLQKEKLKFNGWERKKLEEEIYRLEQIINTEGNLPKWQDLVHVIILPVYKEPREILEQSILSYQNADYPKNKMIIILTVEDRTGDEEKAIAESLKKQFAGTFCDFIITYHPDNVVGEIKGKGSNLQWATKNVLKKYLDEKKIDYKKVLLSLFDCDTRVPKQYFACLTYNFVITQNRHQRGYQPIALYSNNIWSVPVINRLVAIGSSFWQLIETARPYHMVNFASQSMSFEMLKNINFLDPKIVSEDSRHYFRAFFKFHGDYQVVPLSLPIYMDAVLENNLLGTLKGQYLQKRRWAYGVEHFPYIVMESQKHREIPLFQRLLQIYRAWEGHVSLATTSLLVAFVAWLPFFFHPEFRNTVLGFNMPGVVRAMLGLTWTGILISTIIGYRLIPKRPEHLHPFRSVMMILQWIFVPISAIFFGSIPSIDAQTRLMFGKYLGFWVTPKVYIDDDAKK